MEEKILNMLKDCHSFEEIQGELHLSNQEMSSFLSTINDGIKSHYNHIKFYSTGKRGYSNKILNDYGIITEKDSNSYKGVFISDTHFGSNKENIKYIDKVYDYCINNDLHNIFHLGDLVDGTTGFTDNKDLNPIDQVNHVIKDYPTCKSILNFVLFGNHDLDIINLDKPLHDEIMKNRKDLICLGYGTKDVFIKNDSIILKHSILIDKTDNNYNGKLVFKGHSHIMKLVDDLCNHHIYVPSLSDLQFVEGTIPGFISFELNFYNGFITECLLTHYGILDNRLIKMNTVKINIKSHKKEDSIQREESFLKIKRL